MISHWIAIAIDRGRGEKTKSFLPINLPNY
jgi:hypothetical protein